MFSVAPAPAYTPSSAVINPIGYVKALFPFVLDYVVYKSFACGHLN